MQRIVYAAAFLLAMMLNAVAADPWGGGSGSFAGGTVPGNATFSGNVRIDGTLDQRGAISNGGSATCGATAVTGSAGSACVNDALTVVGTTLRVVASGNTAGMSLNSISSGSGDMTASFLALIGSAGLYAGTSIGAAAGTSVLSVGDGCTQTNGCNATLAGAFYGEGLFAFGNTHQTQTFAAAGNLNPTSSRVILTCSVAASSFAVTIQETTVAATSAPNKATGADVTICSSPASDATCTLTFADVANAFEGAAPSLGRGDCFHMFYADVADDLWIQDSPVQDNF